MSPPPPQEPPDEGGGKKADKKVKYKRTLSQRTLEARARAGTLLGDRYRRLRVTCPDLPRAGYLKRAEIIEAGLLEIQSLQEKVGYLRGQLNSGGVPAPRLPGLVPLGSRGYHGARGWSGSQLLQPDPPPTAQARDGSQLLRSQPDSLRIIDVRGGSELLQPDPSPTAQVRGGSQLLRSQPDSGQITESQGWT